MADSPLPPYFEATAFSTEVGAAKPEPAIYLAACTALEVSPAHASTSVTDATTSSRRRPRSVCTRSGRRSTRQRPELDRPTVTSFTELPALLGV